MNDFTKEEFTFALGKLMRDRAINSVPQPTLQDWADRMNTLGIDPEQCARAVEAFIANPPSSRGWPQWSEFLPYLRKFTKSKQSDAPTIYPVTWGVDGNWSGDWDSVGEEYRLKIAGYVCSYWEGAKTRIPITAREFVEFLSPGFLEKWRATRLEEDASHVRFTQ